MLLQSQLTLLLLTKLYGFAVHVNSRWVTLGSVEWYAQGRKRNWNLSGRKFWRHNLRHYAGVCLEGMITTNPVRRVGVLAEVRTGHLPIQVRCWLTCSVKLHNVQSKTVSSDLTFTGPCIVINFYSKTNQMHQCIKFILFGVTLYMFRTERRSETCRVSFQNKII